MLPARTCMVPQARTHMSLLHWCRCQDGLVQHGHQWDRVGPKGSVSTDGKETCNTQWGCGLLPHPPSCPSPSPRPLTAQGSRSSSMPVSGARRAPGSGWQPMPTPGGVARTTMMLGPPRPTSLSATLTWASMRHQEGGTTGTSS